LKYFLKFVRYENIRKRSIRSIRSIRSRLFNLCLKFSHKTVEDLMGSSRFIVGTAVTQCLRYCATNRKVAGSIPDVVIGIFH
jgi:hypothetical protein